MKESRQPPSHARRRFSSQGRTDAATARCGEAVAELKSYSTELEKFSYTRTRPGLRVAVSIQQLLCAAAIQWHHARWFAFQFGFGPFGVPAARTAHQRHSGISKGKGKKEKKIMLAPEHGRRKHHKRYFLLQAA